MTRRRVYSPQGKNLLKGKLGKLIRDEILLWDFPGGKGSILILVAEPIRCGREVMNRE